MVRAVMVAMVWPVLGCVMTEPTRRPMDWAVSRLNSTAAQLAKKEPALYLQGSISWLKGGRCTFLQSVKAENIRLLPNILVLIKKLCAFL